MTVPPPLPRDTEESISHPVDDPTGGRRDRAIGVAVLAAVTLTLGAFIALALASGGRLSPVSSPGDAGGMTGKVPAAADAVPGVLPADPRGRPAPDFTLPRLDGTGPLTLSRLRGKVVVVNYWAAWCTTCRAEAAALARGYRTWQARGVTFLGVDVQDREADARRFEQEFGLGYPSVTDPSGAVMRRYGVTGLPETYVIDRQGRVAAKWVGPIDAASLDSLLTSATAG